MEQGSIADSLESVHFMVGREGEMGEEEDRERQVG